MTDTPTTPPEAAEQKMRQRFEAWMSDDGEWPKAIQRNGDSYFLAITASNWAAWQAAWEAASRDRLAGLPAASQPEVWSEQNIESPFNACMYRGYCLSLKAKIAAAPVCGQSCNCLTQEDQLPSEVNISMLGGAA